MIRNSYFQLRFKPFLESARLDLGTIFVLLLAGILFASSYIYIYIYNVQYIWLVKCLSVLNIYSITSFSLHSGIFISIRSGSPTKYSQYTEHGNPAKSIRTTHGRIKSAQILKQYILLPKEILFKIYCSSSTLYG